MQPWLVGRPLAGVFSPVAAVRGWKPHVAQLIPGLLTCPSDKAKTTLPFLGTFQTTARQGYSLHSVVP